MFWKILLPREASWGSNSYWGYFVVKKSCLNLFWAPILGSEVVRARNVLCSLNLVTCGVSWGSDSYGAWQKKKKNLLKIFVPGTSFHIPRSIGYEMRSIRKIPLLPWGNLNFWLIWCHFADKNMLLKIMVWYPFRGQSSSHDFDIELFW